MRLKKMADSEDCQLSDLQNEFKKLRVDFSNLCRNQEKQVQKNYCRNHLVSVKEREVHPPKSEHFKCRVICTCSKPSCRKKRKKFSAKNHLVEKPIAIESITCLESGLREIVEAVKQTVEESDPSKEHTDDITVDELAGYFENFVYIPKKMSHMAEMMYT